MWCRMLRSVNQYRYKLEEESECIRMHETGVARARKNIPADVCFRNSIFPMMPFVIQGIN